MDKIREAIDDDSEKDRLFAIFEHHFLNCTVAEESPDSFIDRVVRDFIVHLSSFGHIPERVLNHLKEDLREEVGQMYRKKTYGQINLTDLKHCAQRRLQRPRRYS